MAEQLLAQNITTIGTLQMNRVGLPTDIKSLTGREEFDYQIRWEKEHSIINVHSYAVHTKSKGPKNVMLLSTVQPYLGVTKDDGKKKPSIYKVYDFTKGKSSFSGDFCK